jgi:hypothetical protein
MKLYSVGDAILVASGLARRGFQPWREQRGQPFNPKSIKAMLEGGSSYVDRATSGGRQGADLAVAEVLAGLGARPAQPLRKRDGFP